MTTFTRSISLALKGAAHAFEVFPAAILNALAFAIVTVIRIELDWPQQEPYNFLFNCLHWSFAFGAIFSLAVITASWSRFKDKKAFYLSNLLGIAGTGVALLLLYFFGKAAPDPNISRFSVLSMLAVARVTAAILVSFLAFIMLAGFPKEQSDLSRSFFMTHKAFFIALIYGSVIMAGVSGVAGAVQALLYHQMSSKVYMYIGTVTGFLAFTIFIGYFPDFRMDRIDPHREIAQKQPRFVEVLFGSIMIPIFLALTAVLLIWAGKTLWGGMGSSFVRLSGIASSFAIVGIWLHMMTAHHETGLAKFYRRFYPIAALIILAFEAWALFTQLEKSGLKTTEYSFILLWILTAAAAVLLILIKDKAYPVIFSLTCILAVIWVLPIIGAHALPVTAQVNRLENLLTEQAMLQNGEIVPAVSEPDKKVRESITDAVLFLAYSEDAKLPAWLDKSLGRSDIFKAKMGFEQTWPEPDGVDVPGGYLGLSLTLPAEAVDISDYRWSVLLREYYVRSGNDEGYTTLKGDKGTYQIYWIINEKDNIPTLKILLDERVIIEQDLNDYLDRLTKKYPPGKSAKYVTSFDDMSLKLETPELKMLLVINNIDINVDPSNDIINYWMNPYALYLSEK
ncbi:DUF4153 domain-containing protein [Dehalobacterium formicoaceticum]|uniref:DUF4153 domain-containing protein n=1 Tax=Dehalobacterium formicoaceticum TaxID=51515 RepID=A0ABT1Y741_9FIRM|nr:DUF4153 domain-containing protein [Dehalobacterium formicoaceticum]MCR6546368.1 DUF4153 domain-containing protein [Dehalobacterium formicoaceticum]